jgi:hypothetical protein
MPTKVTLMLNKHLNIKRSNSRFRIELTVVIAIKAILLWLIWHFFFAHPVEQSLTAQQYQQHFFSDNKQPTKDLS